MAQQQAIKRRIRSVKNTRQITKAMQLVAASKLRRAQEAALRSRAYADAANQVLRSLTSTPETTTNYLFQSRQIKKTLSIVVTSDRGLAGGYNANVLKQFTNNAVNRDGQTSAICIGKFSGMHIAKLSDVVEVAAFSIDEPDISADLAQPVLSEAIKLFKNGDVDAVEIIYTRFVSTVSQEVITEQLLPIMPVAGDEIIVRELEPSAEELLDFAAKRLLEAKISQSIVDARASEQAARMLAMKNATDNAGELIEDLTLIYNNARQAAITQELAEISAGAVAITE